MSNRERIERSLWRLRQAIDRIEADMSGKFGKPHDPSISQADHDCIMRLIRLAIWDTAEPEWPHLTPENEDRTWFWALGRQIGIDNTPDDLFWSYQCRLDTLKMLHQHGTPMEELELSFGRPEVVITKGLVKLGLLPSSDPLQ